MERRYLGRTMFVVQLRDRVHYTKCLHYVYLALREGKLGDKAALDILEKANEMRAGESIIGKTYAVYKEKDETYMNVNFINLHKEYLSWV